MKLLVTFKDPDGPSECIDEAVRQSIAEQGITDTEEVEAMLVGRREKVMKVLRRWIEYGEYVAIEFDTDAGTAVVVPVK